MACCDNVRNRMESFWEENSILSGNGNLGSSTIQCPAVPGEVMLRTGLTGIHRSQAYPPLTG